MDQKILRYLKEYSHDTLDINRLIVSSFLILNKIDNVQNTFIRNYIINENDILEFDHLNKFLSLFSDRQFGLEELIEFFEFVISPLDKEINGAVYTPENIRRYIVRNAIDRKLETGDKILSDIMFADIACGCGGFFKTITEFILSRNAKSYFEIYRDNIFGLDIQEYSIIRTKILLILQALVNHEDHVVFEFNLFCGNALDFNWNTVPAIEQNNGLDIIVGNPPYVGVVKMDDNTRTLLKRWKVSQIGKPDLYIPFFEIALNYLQPTGVLGYITVNTFYKSLNGRSLRLFFSENSYELSIVDFGGEQLFKTRSTYTCICMVSKNEGGGLRFVRTASKTIDALTANHFVTIPYEDLDDLNGWHLINADLNYKIAQIEKAGTPLGEKFTIRNGFATLRNNVYVFTPIRESDRYYYFQKDEIEFRVEKEICRDCIKPNTLKSEEELPIKIEKLIFPYRIQVDADLFEGKQRKIEIIGESELRTKFPSTYRYLNSNRATLSERDRGTKDYEKWYAYGRNQALTLSGYKLLFPYISDKPCFVFTEDQELLFYNGYAVLCDSIQELAILKKILMSKVFWFYIVNTSKPYSGKFFSIAKNYIKNFGICDLNAEEKLQLLELTDQDEIDNFLEHKYELVITPVLL